MRELTKSVLSLSWAMSLFGLKQAASLLSPGSNAAGSFEAVTRCTEDQLGPTIRSTFRTGDNLQRGLVDLTFSLFSFGLWQPRAGRGGGIRGNVSPGDADRRSWGQGAAGQGGWSAEGAGSASGSSQGAAGWQGAPSPGFAGAGAESGGGWTFVGADAAAAGADVLRGVGNLTAQAVSGGIDLARQGIHSAYQVAGSAAVAEPSSAGSQDPPSGEYQTPGAQTP
jgi:hypothetical protein